MIAIKVLGIFGLILVEATLVSLTMDILTTIILRVDPREPFNVSADKLKSMRLPFISLGLSAIAVVKAVEFVLEPAFTYLMQL